MALQLRAVADREVVFSTDLRSFVIGRGEDVDFRIVCRWASRKHCEIVEQNGVYWLRDLQSRYGTTVNGQPVNETELSAGDEVTIGLQRFIIEVLTDADDHFSTSSCEVAQG